ncbi:MAG: hypothetical protein KGL95_03035 [Patescibacteria group bacterium]|nr:hypothetical protein [Patescibacteria group bacterium]
MLQKKLLNKRRVRNFIPTIVFLSSVFLLTSGALFAWYFTQKLRAKQFISPLVSQTTKKQQAIVNPDTSTQIEDLLKRNSMTPVSVTIASDSALLVTLDSGEQIIFSQKKDLSEQITSLQLIKRELTIEGKRLNRVDFRFDNPIITF